VLLCMGTDVTASTPSLESLWTKEGYGPVNDFTYGHE